MGAGIRHGATAEIGEEMFELRLGEGINGFDRVAADRLGDHIFAQSPRMPVASKLPRSVVAKGSSR